QGVTPSVVARSSVVLLLRRPRARSRIAGDATVTALASRDRRARLARLLLATPDLAQLVGVRIADLAGARLVAARPHDGVVRIDRRVHRLRRERLLHRVEHAAIEGGLRQTAE